MKESHVRYHPSDIYIEQNKSNYFDQLSFLNMKRALNINKKNDTLYCRVGLFKYFKRKRSVYQKSYTTLTLYCRFKYVSNI